MPYKKKATPGTVQFNKLISELPGKERILKHRLNSDMIFQDHKNGLITKANLIDSRGLRNYQD